MGTSPDRPELVRRWYEAGYYAESTIGEELAATTSDGEVVFVRADGGEEEAHLVSDLRARGRRLASGLASAGVRPGDVVAVQAPTSPEQLAVMVAVWSVGAVLLPIVDIYGHSEVSFILGQSGARHLVVPTEWRARSYAAEALDWDLDLDAVIAIGDDVPTGAVPVGDLDGGREAPPVSIHADDVALLVYTSGTTSEPKGVQHSHNSLLAGGFRSPDPLMSALCRLGTFPAGHIAGVLSSLSCLLSGGKNVIMDRWSARLAAELIERHGVMMSSGTPFYLATLLDEAERTGRDISPVWRRRRSWPTARRNGSNASCAGPWLAPRWRPSEPTPLAAGERAAPGALG